MTSTRFEPSWSSLINRPSFLLVFDLDRFR